MQLLEIGNPVTMTSLELVQFINNQRDAGAAELMHSDFLKKVIQVLGGAGNFSSTYLDTQNKVRPCYALPKREACLMAMSYSYDLQAKVFDRMTELETKNTVVSSFRLPLTYSAAMRLAADQADQIELQQSQLAITTPKAEALDRLTLADGSMCITNAAKNLGMQPKALFAWLQTNNWIYRRPGSGSWTAYQPRLKSMFLDHKVTTIERGDGSEKITEQVLVTAKGLAKLAEITA
jgi:phage antirepressor YoqD-like protein